jgi:class 3 adenylate cyclase
MDVMSLTKGGISDEELYKPKTHINACICMIDIVNFSSWCNTRNPAEIFKAMTKYNKLLSTLIENYDGVRKIEMVGDCVMIMGGWDTCCVHKNVTNIINLAIDVLEMLESVRSIFDQTTSLRIGIHTGDIYSGFIENPRKFQLFGNSINIASRLESYSLPGTFTISEITYNSLCLDEPVSERILNVIGKPKSTNLKGVGNFVCISGFIKTNNILVADDDETTCEIFARICFRKYELNSTLVYTINDTFQKLKESQHALCILDVNFLNIQSIGSLVEFRDWESMYRNTRQKIFLTTLDIDQKLRLAYSDMIDGFIDKARIYVYDEYPSL